MCVCFVIVVCYFSYTFLSSFFVKHYNFHSLCKKLGGDIDVECPGQLRAWPNDDYSSMCTFHYEGGRLVEIEVDREIGKMEEDY